MKPDLAYVLVLVLVSCVLASSATNAQVLGPTLGEGVFELGYTYKWYHRDLDPGPPAEGRWEIASLYIRYGALEWATLSLEGGYWTVGDESNEDPNYKRYTAGVGVAIRVAYFHMTDVVAVVHYGETHDNDRSSHEFHKRMLNTIAGVQVGRSVPVFGQTLDLWSGLFYVHDDTETWLWGSTTTLEGESTHDLGFGIGTNAVLVNRIDAFAHVLLVDHAQWRLGVGLRLW